jgi:peptide/nickel transport system permease protein
MSRYVFRRLALIPLALLLANFAGFAYAHLVRPLALANNPLVAVSAKAAPLLPAYAAYLRGVLRLDFGQIPPSGAPVLQTIASAAVASLGLLGIALALSVLIGVGLGISAVRVQPAGIAAWLTVGTTVGLAMPGFYIGTMLLLVCLNLLIYGSFFRPPPIQGFGWDAHLILPVLVLAARPTAQIAQVTASLLAGEMDKMYVTAARSVGVRLATIRRRHALRNIVAPLAAAVFGSLRLMIGELILVEWIFSWPGLGRQLALTLLAPESTAGPRPVFLHAPLLAATLTVLAAVFLAGDLLAGVVARVADPRLRAATEQAEGGAYAA